MIRSSGSWCIGRCGATNYAIPACATMLRTREVKRCDQLSARQAGRCPMRGKGLLIRRALDLMSALKLAVHIGLDEIHGDEFCAMLIIAEERDLLEREKRAGQGQCQHHP